MNEDFLKGYKVILGLEIHLQLNTENKMFCRCSARNWGQNPNTSTCPTCLGLPGALPVPNLEAVKKTQLFGLSLGCVINKESGFDRKHYFYPDLPKGYQISQYKKPLCENGSLKLDSDTVVEIERIHLEEDTAKSFHQGSKTFIDYNKSGVPLMEIVTSPCFSNVEDSVEFGRQIRILARYLGISDADMEKGNLRVEPNISLRTAEMEKANKLPDYKVEIKNINSFKFMEKAVISELIRQADILSKGETPIQENRGYDENKNITVPQRSKEEAHDYRYFPEPDIPPLSFDDGYISELRNSIPKLPWEIKADLIDKYSLNKENVKILTDNIGPEYSLKLIKVIELGADPIKALNAFLNTKELLDMDTDEIFKELTKKTEKISDEGELIEIVKIVLSNNKSAVSDYKTGKNSAIEFLLGMVMRETKGKADPDITRKIIKSNLDE